MDNLIATARTVEAATPTNFYWLHAEYIIAHQVNITRRKMVDKDINPIIDNIDWGGLANTRRLRLKT